MALFRQYYNEISNASQVKKPGRPQPPRLIPYPGCGQNCLPPPFPHGVQRLPEPYDGLDMFIHSA